MAIIAVMVAIAIPTFGKQLEKSREATDISNVRAAYATVAAESLTDPDVDHSATVDFVQTVADWETTGSIAGVEINNTNIPVTGAGAHATITYTSADNKIRINDVEVPSLTKSLSLSKKGTFTYAGGDKVTTLTVTYGNSITALFGSEDVSTTAKYHVIAATGDDVPTWSATATEGVASTATLSVSVPANYAAAIKIPVKVTYTVEDKTYTANITLTFTKA